MYRASEEKSTSPPKTFESDQSTNNKGNLSILPPRRTIPLSILLIQDNHSETHFHRLLNVIIKGNFRAVLLPTLRRLVADQPSEATAKILALLHRLYDFRNHELPFSKGWNKGYTYPPLDLSSKCSTRPTTCSSRSSSASSPPASW